MLTPEQFAQAMGLAPTAKSAAAPAQAFVHVTQQGDRWDTIAWKYYGDVSRMGFLVLVNPAVPAYPEFDAGVEIVVPLVPASPGSASAADLPPWRRNG